MTLEVIFRSIARIEFEESVDWYDAQQDGLGDEFEFEIQQAIGLIEKYPRRFPIIERDVRQARLIASPFPSTSASDPVGLS